MVYKYQNMDEDDDLEALRLAALQTIRPRAPRDILPLKNQTDSAAFFRPSNNPNLITIVPLDSKNKQKLNENKKCDEPETIAPTKISGREKNSAPKEKEPPPDEKRVESKFNRFRDSKSDSDDDSTERNITLSSSKSENVKEEEGGSNLNDDDDSLEKLMDQMEKEFRGETAVKKEDKKSLSPPRKRTFSPEPQKKILRVRSPSPYNRWSRSPPRRSPSPGGGRRRRSPSPKRRPVQKWISRRNRASPPPPPHGSRRRRSATPPAKVTPPRFRDQSPLRRKRSVSPSMKKTLGGRDRSPTRSPPQPPRRKRSLSPPVKKASGGVSPRFRDQSPPSRRSPPLPISRRKRSLSPGKKLVRGVSPRSRDRSPPVRRRRSASPSQPVKKAMRVASPRRKSPVSWSHDAYPPESPSHRPHSPSSKWDDYSHSGDDSERGRQQLSGSPLPPKRRKTPVPNTASKIRPRGERADRKMSKALKGESGKHSKSEENSSIKNGKRKEEKKVEGGVTSTKSEEQPAANPILEARRKKFESNNVVSATNKKIRLNPGKEPAEAKVPEVPLKTRPRKGVTIGEAKMKKATKGKDGGQFVDYSSADILLLDVDYNLEELEEEPAPAAPSQPAKDNPGREVTGVVERTRKLDLRNSVAQQPQTAPKRRKRPSNDDTLLVQKRKISVNIKPTALKALEEKSKKISEQKTVVPGNSLVTAQKKIVLEKGVGPQQLISGSFSLEEGDLVKKRPPSPVRIKSYTLDKAGEDVVKNNRAQPSEDTAVGVDLRAELCRRRAERLKGGPKLVPITRLLQSAFEGVVGNNKPVRNNRPNSPEGAATVQKPSVPTSKGRRVQVVQRERLKRVIETGSQDSDAEYSDENVRDSQHNACSHLNSASGRSILHRNQVSANRHLQRCCLGCCSCHPGSTGKDGDQLKPVRTNELRARYDRPRYKFGEHGGIICIKK